MMPKITIELTPGAVLIFFGVTVFAAGFWFGFLYGMRVARKIYKPVTNGGSHGRSD